MSSFSQCLTVFRSVAAGNTVAKDELSSCLKWCRSTVCKPVAGFESLDLENCHKCIDIIVNLLKGGLLNTNAAHIGLQFLCNCVVVGNPITTVEQYSKFLRLIICTQCEDVKTTSLISALLFQCCTKHCEFADEICIELVDKTEFLDKIICIWRSDDKYDFMEWNLFLLEVLFSSKMFGIIFQSLPMKNRLDLFHCFSNHAVAISCEKLVIAICLEFCRHVNDIISQPTVVLSSELFKCLAVLLEIIADLADSHKNLINGQCSEIFDRCLDLLEWSAANLPHHDKYGNGGDQTPFNFKCHTIQLLSQLIYRNDQNKVKLSKRESSLFSLVDLTRRIDMDNPFASQWCILAIRNACENCPEMSKSILEMMSGSDFLKKLDINLEKPIEKLKLPEIQVESIKNVEFHYSSKDFVKLSEVEHGKVTNFGDFFHSQYEKCANNEGVMRFRCKNMLNREVIGNGRKYIAHFIQGRLTNRRPAGFFERVADPPKEGAFNFSKCRKEEILFSLRCTDEVNEEEIEQQASKVFKSSPVTPCHERNLVMVNVSPISEPSCLLVPDRLKILPQILTQSSLKTALHLMLLWGDRNLRIGFNSLCAFASVNHLHLHIWSSPFDFYVENVEMKKLTKFLYELEAPSGCPVPGFAVDLVSFDGNINKMAQMIYLLCDCLVIIDIPHNLAICWGTSLDDGKSTTIRCIIWPKRKIEHWQRRWAYCGAPMELSGYLVVKDEEKMKSLDDADDVDFNFFLQCAATSFKISLIRQKLIEISNKAFD